jgi:hypothetical protein
MRIVRILQIETEIDGDHPDETVIRLHVETEDGEAVAIEMSPEDAAEIAKAFSVLGRQFPGGRRAQ